MSENTRRRSAGQGLGEYRRRRDPARTPEPVPGDDQQVGGPGHTFVVQEHHARALHWDFRLERGGVLVSWAVPKGLPQQPGVNRLAVHTEDHPLEYGSFHGEIPAGEYGGGQVLLWDTGSYSTEDWTDAKVTVALQGDRVEGRYVLFHTDGDNWMVRRLSAPTDPDRVPLPELVRPMLAVPDGLPAAEAESEWGFEFKWDGVRAIGYVEGGRIRLMSRNDRDITETYPELRALAAALGSTETVLDGELVAFDERTGRPSFGALQQRMHVTSRSALHRLAGQVPVTYLLFDVLHLDGRSLLRTPYRGRRSLLEELGLSGPSWQTPPYYRGSGGDVLAASRANGLEGVVAKRLDSPYDAGKRSANWIKVKNLRTQDVIVGGWKAGEGRRAGRIGSLLLGIPGADGLEYVGNVGTGFTERALDLLGGQLHRLDRKTSPFTAVPREQAKDAKWVTPKLVGEVVFSEWTKDGRLRHPSWRGLRPDRSAEEVVREPQ